MYEIYFHLKSFLVFKKSTVNKDLDVNFEILPISTDIFAF